MEISSVVSDLSSTQVDSQADVLGKNDFLKLLIVQLQNQDPLNPQENLDSISQMAEFSSLEAMQNIQDLLQQQMSLSESGFNAQMLGLIGKEVRAVNDLVTFKDDTKPRIAYDAESAGQVVVSIVNSSGRVVQSEHVLAEKGLNYFNMEDWDVPDGVYQVQVKPVLSGDGSDVTSSYNVYTVGIAQAVDFSGGTPIVDLDGQLVDISAIVDVRAAGYSFPVSDGSGSTGGDNNSDSGDDGSVDDGSGDGGSSSGGGSSLATLIGARGSSSDVAAGDRSGRSGLSRGLFGAVGKVLSVPNTVVGSVLDILN